MRDINTDAVLNAISDAITLHGPDYTIIAANRAARELLSLRDADIGLIKCHQAFHGDDTPHADCAHGTCLETQAASHCEFFEPHLGRHLQVQCLPGDDVTGMAGSVIHVTKDVTNLRQAQREREETEDSFRQLVDNIPICLALVDPQQNIFYLNKHLTRTMGYTLQDVPTMSEWWPKGYPDETYRAEVIARWSKAVQTAISTGSPIVAEEYNVTCKDGSVLVMDIFGAPVGSNHLVIFSDKTERKCYEQALLQSKEQYERVMEHSPVGITVYDRTGQCIAANQATADIIGATREQVLAQNFHKIQSWRESGLYEKALLALEHNRVESFEVKFLSSFGRQVYVSCFMVPFVPEGLLFIAHDSSRQMKAEEDLRQNREQLEALVEERTEELARSERRYRDLISATDTGFVVVDERGMVFEANKPYLAMTGRQEPREVIGHTVLQWTAPERQEENAAALSRCVKQGFIRDFETTYLQPDGSRREILVDAMVQYLPEGILITSFCRDISQRKHDEQRRLRADKLESLGLLAGGIAHDFNNKLNIILNNIALAKLSLDPSDKAYQRLEEIDRTYWQTTHLTNQLMTLSKGSPMQKTVFSLDGVLRDTVHFTLSGSSVSSTFDIAGDLFPIEADMGQINQVISNIVLNARDSMRENGGVVRVTAQNVEGVKGSVKGTEEEALSAPLGPFVAIQFRDTGVGIPPADIDRIFDPFYSSKELGHGIGLATSHSIVTRHGGTIEVESMNGRGTSVTVYLPASLKPVAVKQAGAPLRNRIPSMRILIMEDEEGLRDSLTELLEGLGHSVLSCDKGETAFEKYLQALNVGNVFDLVILDMTIKGGMGGMETIQALRKIHPEVKAIVASGYSDQMTMTNYQMYGFMGYLKKPYGIEDLMRELAKVVSVG